MPSAHLSARPKPISRSQGESATAAAAYRARCQLRDERTGQTHDYSPKSRDLLFEGMYAPANAPEWAKDRTAFWNHVEAREKRKDSQLAREFVIALPHELTLEQNRRLIQDFVREAFVRPGYVADVVIHRPHAHSDERNIHAHVMVPLRKFERGDWCRNKDRFVDGKPDVNELVRLREKWEHMHNKAMERYGHEGRISMGSLADQGIDREPEIHLGKRAAAMEREGIDTERGDQLRNIQRVNLERALTEETGHHAQVYELKRIAVPQQSEDAQIISAIDRKLDEEREEERRHRISSDPARRGVLAAIWRLSVTAGASLAHIILGTDRAELLLGRMVTREHGKTPAEIAEERRRAKVAPDPQRSPLLIPKAETSAGGPSPERTDRPAERIAAVADRIKAREDTMPHQIATPKVESIIERVEKAIQARKERHEDRQNLNRVAGVVHAVQHPEMAAKPAQDAEPKREQTPLEAFMQKDKDQAATEDASEQLRKTLARPGDDDNNSAERKRKRKHTWTW